jgi:hypothetical protein
LRLGRQCETMVGKVRRLNLAHPRAQLRRRRRRDDFAALKVRDQALRASITATELGATVTVLPPEATSVTTAAIRAAR